MTYLEYTSFDKQKKSAKNLAFKDKSGDIKKAVIVRENLFVTLYAQQYSANFGVYFNIVDPIVKSTKKL